MPVPAASPLLPLLLADLTRSKGELGWMDLALCAQTDPEAFFPEKGGSLRQAKAVCQACEVRAECLAYALDNRIGFGIWGGLSERQRSRLRPPQAGGPRKRAEECQGGHRRTPENTRVTADGSLRCRVCERNWAAAARNRRAA